MSELYKTLLLSGVLFTAFGAVMMLPDVLGLGRLPGDIRARFGRVTVPIPLATTLVVSVTLWLLVAIAMRAT